jgi:iron-sulfur cluster repair protein YtfE (RIC family)
MHTAEALCNTRDMVMVHRAFRREFGLLPQLVLATAPHDRERAQLVAAHAEEMISALGAHHEGEDDLLWPRLRERAVIDPEVIDRMEAQHAGVAAVLTAVHPLLASWKHDADVSAARELAGRFAELAERLDEHLADEEQEILPIVERCITVGEWSELAEHGLASMPKRRRLVLLGHILEEASSEESVLFLGKLPPPVRVAYRLIGRPRHARETALLRGQ